MRSGTAIRGLVVWGLLGLPACASMPYFLRSTLPTNGLEPSAARQVQFYIAQGFTLAAQSQTRDDRGVENSSLTIRQELERRSILVKPKLPAVALTDAEDVIRIDIGKPNRLVAQSLVLTFTSLGARGGAYVLTHILDQPISGSVEIDGFRYSINTRQDILLKYQLGEDLKIVTRRANAPGRRLPE